MNEEQKKDFLGGRTTEEEGKKKFGCPKRVGVKEEGARREVLREIEAVA